MYPKIQKCVFDAAVREGWKSPAAFHRVLHSIGVEVSYQTAINWWSGKGRVSAPHVPAVAELLGVPAIVLYKALSGSGA